MKVRENKARRAAIRQGMELRKSRRRDAKAIDYGGYMLVDAATGAPVFGYQPRAYNATLEQVEQSLGM